MGARDTKGQGGEYPPFEFAAMFSPKLKLADDATPSLAAMMHVGLHLAQSAVLETAEIEFTYGVQTREGRLRLGEIEAAAVGSGSDLLRARAKLCAVLNDAGSNRYFVYCSTPGETGSSDVLVAGFERDKAVGWVFDSADLKAGQMVPREVLCNVPGWFSGMLGAAKTEETAEALAS